MKNNSSINNRIITDTHSTVSVFEILLIFAENFKKIFFLTILFAFIGIFYAYVIKVPKFISISKIMSSSSGDSPTSQAIGLASQFGLSLPSLNSEPKWVYAEIIKSRSLAKKIISKSFQTEKYSSKEPLFKILLNNLSDEPIKLKSAENEAIDIFLESVGVSEDLRTSIITLSVESFEPKLASDINNAIISELDFHQQAYNKEKTSKTRKFIEERIRDTEQELMRAENSLKTFMDRNRRIENSPALQLEKQRLNREVVVLTGVFTTLKQQLETTKIEEVKDSDYVIIIDDPNEPLSSSKPNRRFIVIIFTFFGFTIGTLISFFNENLKRRSSEELKVIKKIKDVFWKNFTTKSLS